ncbi:MAG TPA: hypothetical protein DCP03_02450 [Polaromonas sp.]|nr:hypothetical protein [Polaromonas sp.]
MGFNVLDFYKPMWLYERLPYLYVAAGGVTIATLENAISLFSGGLLIMAGVHVWKMRRTDRRKIKIARQLRECRRLNRSR